MSGRRDEYDYGDSEGCMPFLFVLAIAFVLWAVIVFFESPFLSYNIGSYMFVGIEFILCMIIATKIYRKSVNKK